MNNPIVEMMRSMIGRPVTESPSPAAVWLAGTLLEVEEGYIRGVFTIREEMTNPAGFLHGGMAAFIADDIIGACVFTLGLDAFYNTVNLNTNFHYSASLGEEIFATAKIIRKGKKIISGHCELHNADGVLLVTASSNLVRTGKLLADVVG